MYDGLEGRFAASSWQAAEQPGVGKAGAEQGALAAAAKGKARQEIPQPIAQSTDPAIMLECRESEMV